MAIAEAIEAVREAFSFVLVDEERGQKYAAERALALRKRGLYEQAEALLELLPSAVEIIAADDPKSDVAFLKIFLVPGQTPVIQFFTAEHERESRALFDRLSRVLDSKVVVIAPTDNSASPRLDDE